MNLKENYERLFGKMDTFNKLGQKTNTNQKQEFQLTTEQQNVWKQISNGFSHQYPKRTLLIKQGNVVVDGHFVENANKFFKMNRNQQVHIIKTAVTKLKD